MLTVSVIYLVTGLGLWTLTANLCVLLGGKLYHLMIVYPLLAAAVFWIFRRHGEPATPSPYRRREILFLCGATALMAWLHRSPTPDDTIYLNLAVTAADHPGESLMQIDGLFGLDEPSQMLRPYFLHSIELVAAALHVLTGIPAMIAMHSILPPLAGALVALVTLWLSWLLLPRHRFAAATAALVYLALVGDAWQAHGSHGFAHFGMGRSLLVNALLPMVFIATIQVCAQENVRSALLLCMALFAATGASSNGFVLAPACVLLTHVGYAGRTSFRRRSAKLLILATLPTLLLALWAYSYRSDLHPPPPSDGVAATKEVFVRAFGNPVLATVTIALVLFSLWNMRRTLVWRPLLFISAALTTLTLNPLTAGWLYQGIGREGMLPRAWWLLPIPLMASAGILFFTELTRVPKRFVGAATVCAVLLLFTLLPGRHPLRADFYRRALRLRNTYPELRIAQRLVQYTEPEDVVLIPAWGSTWVPTVHQHPKLLFARELYEGYIADVLGKEEAKRRRMLSLFIDGSDRVKDFEPSCEELEGVDVVAAPRRVARAAQWLDECGWQNVDECFGYRIWLRPGEKPSSDD